MQPAATFNTTRYIPLETTEGQGELPRPSTWAAELFSVQGHFSLDNTQHKYYIVNMMITHYRFEIPNELHRAFKSVCAAEGSNMKEKLLEFMKDYVEQQEKKGKK